MSDTDLVKQKSEEIIQLLEGKVAGDVALIACVDAMVRILKGCQPVDTATALDQIREICRDMAKTERELLS